MGSEAIMADLKDVQKRIDELKAQIAPLQRELEILENAARVLRALDGGVPVVPPLDAVAFDQLTIPKAAERILTEVAGRSLHYQQVAEIAMKRGFRGKRTDLKAPIKKIAESFRRMMAQQKDVFEPVGRGLFRINDTWLKKKEKERAV
jgi:HB1, ASXL, restriction endonuclease HTH domain